MRIVVLGASGELGARVVRGLRRHVPEAELLLARRRPAAGHAAVDVTDAAALRALLAGAALVVNAVGPYRWDPGALLAAAVASRCHYADLAEDDAFLAAVARAAEREGAGAAGVAVVPGASTVPGLVELLAQRFAARADVAGIAAELSMGSANPVSAGLLAGLLAPLGRPRAEGGRWFASLSRARVSDGRVLRVGDWPGGFPAGRLALGERRVPVAFRIGFDRAWLGVALRLAAPLVGRLPARALPGLARGLRPLLALLRPFGTPRGVLLVRAEDARGRELARVELHAERDGLDVPAAPPVWLAQRLARDGALPVRGLARLADAVRPADAEAALAAAGFRLVEA